MIIRSQTKEKHQIGDLQKGEMCYSPSDKLYIVLHKTVYYNKLMEHNIDYLGNYNVLVLDVTNNCIDHFKPGVLVTKVKGHIVVEN